MSTREIFLPPGVQMRLNESLGFIPRFFPVAAANDLDALWKVRNTCEEAEVAEVDACMEKLAMSFATPPSASLYVWMSDLDSCVDIGVATIEQLADMLQAYMETSAKDSGLPLPPGYEDRLKTGDPLRIIAAYVHWSESSDELRCEDRQVHAWRRYDDYFRWEPADLPKPFSAAETSLKALWAWQEWYEGKDGNPCDLDAIESLNEVMEAALKEGDPAS